MLPSHPQSHQTGKQVRVDDVQARPRIPWVVGEVDELEQDKLPSAQRVPVNLVSEIYLCWKDEEDDTSERGDQNQRLCANGELRMTPVIPWAQKKGDWVEKVQ